MAGALIMALDVATHTGYAVGRIGEKPRFKTWRLKKPDDEPERAFVNLCCLIRDEILLEGTPDFFCYEAPLSPGALRQEAVGYGKDGEITSVKKVRQTNAKTTYLLVGLAAVAHATPGAWGVSPRKVSVQTVRKAFLGFGRPENPKQLVMDQCRRLGFDVKDDNQADALALWHYQAGQTTVWEKVQAAEAKLGSLFSR